MLAKLNEYCLLPQILFLNAVKAFEPHAPVLLFVTFTQQPLISVLAMQFGCMLTVNKLFWIYHL